MNGLFSISVSSFHSAPRRLLISELCIFGFSWAIFLRCPRDHTMNAFMGRLMCVRSRSAPFMVRHMPLLTLGGSDANGGRCRSAPALPLAASTSGPRNYRDVLWRQSLRLIALQCMGWFSRICCLPLCTRLSAARTP